MEVSIEFGLDAPGALIVVRGVLDVTTVTEFRETLQSLLDSAGPQALVDVTELRLADDPARAALRHLERQFREFGGALRGAVEEAQAEAGEGAPAP
ncbi:MAG: hypothetical protein BGO38_12615 [Cellulomonas sp. 73-145]|uniref:STAS domain-containing protein n=1 Tax=unclassified Cellulomonas TaxID=2620175 RepID=UPI0009283C84|nr:hypothetical protein [Cellulomonas sp. 73-145]MBN9328509.1 hypothetical protein [Cellulomonas sp.]OJV59638.1 MAG: hypothetical protein BGO38_12615 [Cellulomonas sp. 73-145]